MQMWSVVNYADGQKVLRNTHGKQAFAKVWLQIGPDCILSKFGLLLPLAAQEAQKYFSPRIQDIEGV